MGAHATLTAARRLALSAEALSSSRNTGTAPAASAGPARPWSSMARSASTAWSTSAASPKCDAIADAVTLSGRPPSVPRRSLASSQRSALQSAVHAVSTTPGSWACCVQARAVECPQRSNRRRLAHPFYRFQESFESPGHDDASLVWSLDSERTERTAAGDLECACPRGCEACTCVHSVRARLPRCQRCQHDSASH